MRESIPTIGTGLVTLNLQKGNSITEGFLTFKTEEDGNG